MTQILISIGANTPDAATRVNDTLTWLKSGVSGHINVTAMSTPYSTPEISGRYPDYVNAIVKADTSTDIDTLNHIFKQRELQSGRTPASKQSGLVPLDIDILSYGDTVLRPKDMQRTYTTIGLAQLVSIKQEKTLAQVK